MSSDASQFSPPLPAPASGIPNGVAGMLMFVVCEIMLFAAFLSAYLIVSAGAVDWPPPDQPRLPVESTAVFSVFLLLSGLTAFMALRIWRQTRQAESLTRWVGLTVLLGSIFVVGQGWEWAQLINYGLTVRSNSFAGFFYVIIGAHAAHAVGALLLWLVVLLKLMQKKISPDQFYGAQVLWYFVVGLWPLLYVLLYLS